MSNFWLITIEDGDRREELHVGLGFWVSGPPGRQTLYAEFTIEEFEPTLPDVHSSRALAEEISAHFKIDVDTVHEQLVKQLKGNIYET